MGSSSCGADGVGAGSPESSPQEVAFREIVGHLGAALSQSIPEDDQIIMDHVRAAYEIAKLGAWT